MKRVLLLLLAGLAISLGSAAAAQASSPHFLKAQAAVGNDGSLECVFKEAGLGNVPSVFISCSADATAVFACINGGGNHPKASNKETVNGPVSGGGDFPVRNGATSGTISVDPPGAGDFTCPGGQKLVLASVCYADVTLTGLGETTTAEPNPACRVFFAV